ncbi:MAG: ABC transporter substrate-binding protein [Eubacteriales bacterium]|nr:ABC transporter substrate-binding protein [Eubacteriales bacterium]
MKRIVGLGVVFVMIALMLISCSSVEDSQGESTATSNVTVTSGEPTEKEEVKEYEKLTVGTFAFTEGALFGYALEQGYFEDAGLNIETVMFSTGAPINEAFAAEEIDVAVSGLASVFSLAQGNATWIAEFNTTGGLGLYVREGSDILNYKGEIASLPNVYGNAETITGKTFLGPLGTALQFNAVRYAAQFGLDASDIVMTHMEKGPALQAYLAGEGDILCCDPPYSFQAEAAGLIEIAPFEDVTGVNLKDGVFVRKDLLETRREEIVLFIEIMYRAAEELQDYDLRSEFSIKWFGENGQEWSQDDMNNEMAVRDYITAETLMEENYLFGDGMLAIGAYFVDSGQIEEDIYPNIAASYDTSIIEEALGIEVTVAE